MNLFRELFLKCLEEDIAAGDGGAFGGGDSFGHGGAFGNTDFYAPGDSRIPMYLGSVRRPIKRKKSKRRRKSKKRKLVKSSYIPVQRRSLPELLGTAGHQTSPTNVSGMQGPGRKRNHGSI